MTVRNSSWYNANESRSYPVDDAATGVDDNGLVLPNHIIADLNLRFPRHLAAAAFLGAVTVTDRLVTVTIMGAQLCAAQRSRWQNPADPYDVSGGGAVTAGEATALVAALNSTGPRRLSVTEGGPPYYDVDGDGYLTSRDANQLIAYLNSLGSSLTAQPDDAVDITFVPLAAVSLLKPVTRYQQYALTPLQDGVGGWIVLGGGVLDTNFSGRFSTPQQAGILARCARSYPALPVTDLGRLHTSTPLSGIVKLLGAGDIEIVAEDREIPIDGDVHNTELRTVAVVRLRDNSDSGAGRNVFDLYSGPCSGRPESRTCGDPEPIEFINTVGPDCCGTLTIEFQGCAIPAEVTSGGTGIVLDCGLGLSQACLSQDRLPTADGTLPNDYENLCSDYSDIAELLPEESDSDPIFNAPDTSDGVGAVSLPYLDQFDDNGATTLFVPITASSGGVSHWDYLGYESPYEPGSAANGLPAAALATGTLGSLSTVNVVSALSARNFGYFDIDGGSWSTLGKRFITALALDDHDGAKHIAGVLVNFKLLPLTPAKSTYWAVEIDWDSKQLRLSYYSGYLKVTSAAVDVAELALLNWYRLIVDVQEDPDDAEAAWVTAYLADGIPASTIAILGPIHLSTFGAPTGTFGLIAERSWAHFSFVHINHKS